MVGQVLESKIRIAFLVLLVLVGICLGDSSVPPVQVNAQQTEYQEYRSQQLLPDPSFEDTPDITVSGSSNEFSFDYPDRGGQVTLIWNHKANTPLDFPEFIDWPIECRDYILLQQVFSWPYESLPVAVNISIKYRIETEGSFHDFSGGENMFNVKYFLNNSVGEVVAGRSLTQRENETTDAWYLMDKEATINLIEPLIQNQEGVQEAPDDEITFAVFLCPDWFFQYYTYSVAWPEYDGTVSLHLDKIELRVLMKGVSDYSIPAPTVNHSWFERGGLHRPIVEAEGDGTFYTFGSTGAEYVLGKFDQTGHLWTRQSDYSGDITPIGLFVDTDCVLVCGMHSWRGMYQIVVAEYDFSGNLTWTRYHDVGMTTIPFAFAVSDDSIYVVSRTAGELWTTHSSIIEITKLDRNGEIVWSEVYDFASSFESDAICDDTGNLYISCWTNLLMIDPDGDVQWYVTRLDGQFSDIELDSHNHLYAVNSEVEDSYGIIVVDNDGEVTSQLEIDLRYTPEWKEQVVIEDIEFSMDGRLFALTYFTMLDYGTHLLSIGEEGNIMTDETLIGNPGTNRIQDISLVGDGNLYAIGVYEHRDSDVYHVFLYSGISSTPLDIITQLLLPIVAVSAVVVLFVLADRKYLTKKGAPTVQEEVSQTTD